MAFWTKDPKPANPPPTEGDSALSCSFCGKSQREVSKLIAGPKAWICDECIALCNDIVRGELRKVLPPAPATATPLAEALERVVLGQVVACRSVAAALFRHLHGVHEELPHGPIRVLLVGPRGCGKTLLGKHLCTPGFTGLPAYHADASRMSETGYIGENVENIVGALLSRAPDEELGRRGVLFLDGLHHLVRQPHYPNARDVAGREAQRDLVRLLDGLDIAAIRGQRRHPQAPATDVACDRLMIVAAATFETTATDETALREELGGFGLVDEMLARFDVVVPMRRLGGVELAAVAQQIAAPIVAQIEAFGGSVVLAEGVEVLAERAARSPDGAFALRAPLERLRERAILQPGRVWTLDPALALELSTIRGYPGGGDAP